MGKRISLKTICVSATLSVLVFHIFITIISSDIQGVEGSNQEEGTFDDISRDEKLQDMMDNQDDMNEVVLEDGRKFKLFEKKRLQHKKAQTYCKNREGKLVRAMNADEMKRLQLLLMRARMVGDQIWIGADKKLWKKYSQKMTGMNRPNLGPDVMQFGGGGPTEMCPALSTSTRSLIPAPCYNQLPFICEFDPGKGKKKKTSGNRTKTGKKNKNTEKVKVRDEMRRKREILSMPFTTDTNAKDETEDDLEGSNSTSTILTSVLEFDTSKDGIDPTPQLTSTSKPDEDFILSHKIAFHPHVISALQNTSEYSVQSDDAQTSDYNNVNDYRERSPTPNKRLATSDVHLKFSSKRMLQTPLNDPDQQMLDLINEQSVNMLEDSNTTEEVFNMTNGTEIRLSEKLMSPQNENSINPNVTPDSDSDEPKSEPMAEPESNSITETMPVSTTRSDISSTSGAAMTSPDLGRGTRSFSQPTSMPLQSTVIMTQGSGTMTPGAVSEISETAYSTMSGVDTSTTMMGTNVESMTESMNTMNKLVTDVTGAITGDTDTTVNEPTASGRYTMTTTPNSITQPESTTTAHSTTIRPDYNTVISATAATNPTGDQMSATTSTQGISAGSMSTTTSAQGISTGSMSTRMTDQMTTTRMPDQISTTRMPDQISTTRMPDQISTSRMPDQMSTTTASGLIMSTTTTTGPMTSTTATTGPMTSTVQITTEKSMDKMTTPSLNTTPQSMTATAPKTTIDPMTKPMPTEFPTSTEGLSTGKLGRGGKSFSEPGKLTPVGNGTSDKMASDLPHKGHHNMSLSSLLHPRGTIPPTKVSGTPLTSTSTNSPAALLTLRVKSPVRSRSSNGKRIATTRRPGESQIIPTMKSSIPTLLKPQNSNNSGDFNVLPVLNKLVAG